MQYFRTLILLLIASNPFLSHSQFTRVKIGVNGLTCSACTRSVEMSIRKLAFVDSVSMDLENTIGFITFKKGSDVDINKIAKAVVDAGFSVRYLNADYTMRENNFRADKLKDGKNEFAFLKPKPNSSQLHLHFVGEDFQTKKEFNKSKKEFPGTDFSKENIYYVIPLLTE